jgi:hypothetical protein
MKRFQPPSIALIVFLVFMPRLQAQPPAAERNTFDVREYGATGKKADSATAAIQQAVDACFKAGGGTVYVPPGAYTTGTIELKDNVTLRLEAGATLFLTANRDELKGRMRALIYAEGAKNIAVTGKGTIDGQATYELAAARGESGYTATLFSDDGGRSWSTPLRVTPDGEYPADVTVLESGAIQLTFGRRKRPMGCGALFSEDGGQTWDVDHEVMLAGDGVLNRDLGYPSTVQLADGTIVTALYYASGSEASSGECSWGDISVQAIHYHEEDVR